MHRRTEGVTIVELLIGLGLLSIVVTSVVWGAARLADRARVEAAAGQLLDAYRRTQSVARAWGQPAELVVTADSLVIRAIWHSESTEVWRAPGPGAGGVGVAPAVHVASFLPSGAAQGVANVTHVLSRGAAQRRIVVSRLGRVRIS